MMKHRRKFVVAFLAMTTVGTLTWQSIVANAFYPAPSNDICPYELMFIMNNMYYYRCEVCGTSPYEVIVPTDALHKLGNCAKGCPGKLEGFGDTTVGKQKDYIPQGGNPYFPGEPATATDDKGRFYPSLETTRALGEGVVRVNPSGTTNRYFRVIRFQYGPMSKTDWVGQELDPTAFTNPAMIPLVDFETVPGNTRLIKLKDKAGVTPVFGTAVSVLTTTKSDLP